MWIPNRVHIVLRGVGDLPGHVLQSVKLSHIPEIFTDNECADCS